MAMAASSDMEDIATLHAAAERLGRPYYADPATGYRVFTAATLTARGRCCGCACRHCPYSHANVPMEKRAARIKAPALLRGSFEAVDTVAGGFDVLLWSGGKDSFLAARALCREHPSRRRRLVLLTTFEGTSRQVAHQEVPVDVICRQAECLGLPLVGCPLWPQAAYAQRVAEALQTIQSHISAPLMRVCTGDLHLEHIAQWREEHLGPLISALGAKLYNPLWKVPYPILLQDLEASGTPCRVCASNTDDTRAGDLFDAAFRAQLKPETDLFGENGEFHTLAEVWDATVDDPLLS
jgi:ATP-binding cassette subfamily B (MDR/TAP) protein 1